MKSVLGKLQLRHAQLRVLAKKATAVLGTPDKWTADDIKDLGNIVAGLLPSELQQIGPQVIKTSVEFLEDAHFTLDQVNLGLKVDLRLSCL